MSERQPDDREAVRALVARVGQKQAADALDVSPSTLARYCADFPIHRSTRAAIHAGISREASRQ